MAFSEGGLGETALWGRSVRKTCPWAGFQRRGRNARKIIQWMIFSEGRAVAPERPEGPGEEKERFPPENSRVRFY